MSESQHTNAVLFMFDYDEPVGIEWSVDHVMEQFIADTGDEDSLYDIVRGHSLTPGAWVAELDFVDDGPGDWPGTREYAIAAKSIRRATQEEWKRHAAGEFALPLAPSQDDGDSSR